MDGAVGSGTVTYDLARLMEGAREVRCSEFGDAVIAHMTPCPACTPTIRLPPTDAAYLTAPGKATLAEMPSWLLARWVHRVRRVDA